MGPLFFILYVLSCSSAEIDLEWKNLLHYQKNLTGSFQSSVYNQEFFITASGRNNPEAELKESLIELQKTFTKSDNHFVCRFPMRSIYLNDKYNLKINFNFNECPLLSDFLRRTDPEAISIIFASYGSDGPASLFGHTLFRLHKKGNKSELLDYGVNYAAEVNTTNSFVYGVKGLLGGFDGRFSLLPYFYKMQEYHHMDARDVWDFKLNLTEEESKKVALHLFELDRAKFTYYYLTKNCSYALLDVLDAINPKWKLTEKLEYFVIPIDTVFVLKESGLITTHTVRPSPLKDLNQKIDSLRKEEKDLFYLNMRKIDKGESLEIKDHSAKLVDTLIDYIDLKHSKLAMKKDYSESEKKILNNRNVLLTARSKLTEETTNSHVIIDSPLLSQRARKIYLGFREGENDAYTFGYRFSLHELNDLSIGALSNTTLVMGRFQFDYIPNQNELQINEAIVAEVYNLKPITILETPLSWVMRVGAVNDPLTIKNDPTPLFKGGAGYTFGNEKFAWSLLPTLEGRYKAIRYGGETLLHLTPSDPLHLTLSYERIYEVDDKKIKIDHYLLNGQYSLSKRFALNAKLSQIENIKESSLSAGFYY